MQQPKHKTVPPPGLRGCSEKKIFFGQYRTGMSEPGSETGMRSNQSSDVIAVI